MAVSPGLIAQLEELLEPLGPVLGTVAIKRMFGGVGLFADGLMFGLVADDTLYLKTDAATLARFEAEGLAPFSYTTKTGRHAIMSYSRAPDGLLDDVDAFAEWVRPAFDAARRVAAAKQRQPRRKG